MNKQYFTYIATNFKNTVLYTGITNNLAKRMHEHKSKATKGFTEKYNVNKLVYYEVFNRPEEAIMAEKKIKGWKREKKIKLIKSINPAFKDLIEDSSLCSE